MRGLKHLWSLAVLLLSFASTTLSSHAVTTNKQMVSDQLMSLMKIQESESVGSKRNIKGTIKIDNDNYITICDCPGPSAGTEEPTCDPSQYHVHQDHFGAGLGIADVKTLIGKPIELEHVNITMAHFGCMDGRSTRPTLGTPGGDAGEFILALVVYEDMLMGHQLDQNSVNFYLSEYLKSITRPSFYMCTDDAAIDHLQRDLGLEGLDIRSPPERMLTRISEAVTSYDNVGCMHLRMLLKYPAMYSIRPDIPKMFLKAFYSILWDKQNTLRDKLLLEILPRAHNESAFIELRSTGLCKQQRIAPLVPTSRSGMSSFVNHIDAVSTRRLELAEFFEGVSHHKIDGRMMHNRLNHHGYAFLETTGAYVAKGLPFYTVRIF